MDRLTAEKRQEFDSGVDRVRIGYLTARSEKARRSWERRPGAARAAGVDGRSLEAAVMGLAATHPEYVVVGA